MVALEVTLTSCFTENTESAIQELKFKTMVIRRLVVAIEVEIFLVRVKN